MGIESFDQKIEIPSSPLELIIEPRVKETWEDFLKHCGPFAIAMDGRVIGQSKRDYNLPAANFNHHEDVDRASTLSTSAQVLNEIRLGLFDTFTKDGHPNVRLFVEDCDQDVSTAVALFDIALKQPELLENWKINQLVGISNLLDVTSGMYPLPPNTETMGQHRWVYAPFKDAQRSGEIATIDPAGMDRIIKEITSRIYLFLTDKAESLAFDGRFEMLGGGEGWKMVKEQGGDARAQMVSERIHAFGSVIAEIQQPNEQAPRYKYTLGRLSQWIKFPLPELYRFLNQQEGISKEAEDKWGGSDLSGGSPKTSHSKFTPQELEILINQFLSR